MQSREKWHRPRDAARGWVNVLGNRKRWGHGRAHERNRECKAATVTVAFGR